MSETPQDTLALAASRALQQEWDSILQSANNGKLEDAVTDIEIRTAIAKSINSSIKSYRYVLPTQLSAKMANESLDCRSIQEKSGPQGSFDARSICDKVVVPFDRAHENVLGGSPEPYVNNPLRVPKVSSEHREQQRDKLGWDTLCHVLNAVERQQNRGFTQSVFRQMLIEIYQVLQQVTVRYPVPLRVSLDDCTTAVSTFLAESSGGERPQAVVAALFRTFGEQSKLYASVRSSHVNTSDASSRQVADIECLDDDGKLVLAVEVKDKQLTLRQVQDKIPGLRERHASELLFVALRGVDSSDTAEINEVARKEFVSGQNIYVIEDATPFLRVMLTLLGESGRVAFLGAVGWQLDDSRARIADRRKWAAILGDL